MDAFGFRSEAPCPRSLHLPGLSSVSPRPRFESPPKQTLGTHRSVVPHPRWALPRPVMQGTASPTHGRLRLPFRRTPPRSLHLPGLSSVSPRHRVSLPPKQTLGTHWSVVPPPVGARAPSDAGHCLTHPWTPSASVQKHPAPGPFISPVFPPCLRVPALSLPPKETLGTHWSVVPPPRVGAPAPSDAGHCLTHPWTPSASVQENPAPVP